MNPFTAQLAEQRISDMHRAAGRARRIRIARKAREERSHR